MFLVLASHDVNGYFPERQMLAKVTLLPGFIAVPLQTGSFQYLQIAQSNDYLACNVSRVGLRHFPPAATFNKKRFASGRGDISITLLEFHVGGERKISNPVIMYFSLVLLL
ncbi:hypothetical protein PoB_003823700 [Plakobranchus ocellatus]|uniref:Uncharacterized protein n=1 Tax=Plakobranchus ocellatus TaxID=259542 RepID=A0AAV4AXT4_9GAST|nr:hypothetical protein PoB_003823700 [Plakobranchus ocellatus]